MKTVTSEYLVVGTGIAGLLTAIGLARHGPVLVLTKKISSESNSSYAQGGIACVMSPEDTFDQHVADTLRAGAGLCDEAVVRAIVTRGPARIAELEAYGTEFAHRRTQAAEEEYDLGREGGHSKRRVLHAGDVTGRHVEEALLKHAHANPRITIRENAMVIDLVTTNWLAGRDPDGPEANPVTADRCVGVYAVDGGTGEIFAVRSPNVVLATGGGGKVYLYTSNPDVATGDGVAAAWRAGLPVRNMEFIQFHPTCLYHPAAKSFLISEAVRGEGALLVDANGREFMHKYDERGALASRDIVARAIDTEMKTTGAVAVFLDIRHKSEAFLRDRFPTIYATCARLGIDMATDLVPVVPAAHYFCGGVEAAIDGTTGLEGLFACGEVACTGVHGANRLASNSLLEAIVCAHELVANLLDRPPPSSVDLPSIPDWKSGDAVPSDEAIVVEHNWNEVRTCMWDYVGIVRTNKRLERAARRVSNLRREIREYYLNYLVTTDTLELRNIAAVAELIVRSARQRRESRGLHYMLDYTDAADIARDTIIHDPAGGRG